MAVLVLLTEFSFVAGQLYASKMIRIVCRTDWEHHNNLPNVSQNSIYEQYSLNKCCAYMVHIAWSLTWQSRQQPETPGPRFTLHLPILYGGAHILLNDVCSVRYLRCKPGVMSYSGMVCCTNYTNTVQLLHWQAAVTVLIVVHLDGYFCKL